MSDHDKKPDGSLTPEQEARVALLTQSELKLIDDGLLSNACDRWRKVARVVGTTMMTNSPARIDGIPDIFYAKRVRDLVKRGLLEAAGNLNYMRYSEVRLSIQAEQKDKT